MVAFTDGLLFVALLALSAFFSASEVALLSIGRIRLRMLKRKRARGVDALCALKARPQRMIITVLIGNNLANVGASVLATSIATQVLASNALGVATGVMTFVLLLFGEITPKSFASAHADKIALRVAPFLLLMQKTLKPLVILFECFAHSVPGNYPALTGARRITEEDIRSAVELGAEEKAITEQERKFVEEALDFSDLKARDVLTPASHAVVIPGEFQASQALKLALRSRHWRFPVSVAGKVTKYTDLRKLLLAAERSPETQVASLGRKALVVSLEKNAADLLREMQAPENRFVVVVGDNGEFAGVITITDLLEEFAGESFHEHLY